MSVGHCKLRTSAYIVTDKIICILQNQPGGYLFWASLPRKGRHNSQALRRMLANEILTTLFSKSFLSILLCSALTDVGRPTTLLYKWLLTHVYNNKTHKLYNDWLVSHREANNE